MSQPFKPPSLDEVFEVKEHMPQGGVPSMPIDSILNPEVSFDSAGFFESMFSAVTREQIGMLPEAGVQRYRTENPIKGFTSQMLPEIALFSLPYTKLGKIAVKTIGPAAKLLGYGEKAIAEGRPFVGGAAKFAAETLPIYGARQAASAFAPEEGSFARTAERNTLDLVLGGTFAGTAEFLGHLRGARRPELRASRVSPEGDIATVGRYIEGIEPNLPDQDQYLKMLEVVDNPANAESPALQFARSAAAVLRARIIDADAPPFRGFVTKLPNRKQSAVVNTLFKHGEKLTGKEPEFAVDNIMPRNWPGFTELVRKLEVKGPGKNTVWEKIRDNLTQVDNKTYMTQESDDGLYVVAKRVLGDDRPIGKLLKDAVTLDEQFGGDPWAFSGPARKGGKFVSHDEIPDRWLLFKTNKPWLFAEGGRESSPLLETFTDPRFNVIAEDAFMHTPIMARRRKAIELAPGVPASVLPGNTPALDLLDRLIGLASPHLKGMYAVGKRMDQLETPAFVSRILDGLWQSRPKAIPGDNTANVFLKGGKEAGLLLREAGQVARKIFAPASTGAQFKHTPRAALLDRVMRAYYHAGNAHVQELLWGKLDTEAVKDLGYMKALVFSRKDRRIGGILTKMVEAFHDKNPRAAENLRQFAPIFRRNMTTLEAENLGIHPEVLDVARALDDFDNSRVIAVKANRAALGMEDDFSAMEAHYGLSRMWEGKHRVEVYDELENRVVGYVGGHTPKQALDNADWFVKTWNDQADNAVKLLKPTSENLSTTEYIRYSKELAADASRFAKEVDEYQRGAKINPNNFMTQKFIKHTQTLRNESPERFTERAGFLGYKGQLSPLSLDDILETITGNTLETERLIRKEALIGRLTPQFSKLAAEAPDAYNQLVTRFNAHLGYQGPVAKAMDSVLDKPFTPYWGPNATKRFVRSMNRGMFSLTLGGMDMGFLGLNAMTGIQTIAPEAALLMHTPPSRLKDAYGFCLLHTAQGARPVSYLDPALLTGKAFKKLIGLKNGKDPELMEDLLRARQEGIISKPIINELNEFSAHAAEYMKAGNPVEAVMKFNEDMIGRTEEFSRAWAFITGRDIARDILGKSPEEAFDIASTFVKRTMYEYTAGDRPRILTGAVGSGWGLFKNWSMNYAANLLNYADEAVFKGNWTPLMWAMIGTGSVGGAVAMPFAGMANTFADFVSDKSLTDWTYEAANYGGAAGEWMADGFNYGLPSTLGFTLQGRASAPGSDLLRDSSMFINMGVYDRAVGLYDSFGAVADQWADGNMNALNDKRVQRSLIQAFAPRTLQRAYSYWGAEGYHSLKTGNRLTDKVSVGNAFMHTLGITPLEVEKSFDVQNNLFNDTEELRSAIQYYGASYAQAQAENDYTKMAWVHRRIWENGLPWGSVQRSAASRLQKELDPLLDRQFQAMQVRSAMRQRGMK